MLTTLYNRLPGHYDHVMSSTAESIMLGDGEDGLFESEGLKDDTVEQLEAVFDDPDRFSLLRKVALKSLVVENVDFIQALRQWKVEAEESIVKATGKASDEVKLLAKLLFEKYLEAGSDEEVNISSSTRQKLKMAMEQWVENVPMLTNEEASQAFQSNIHGHNKIFDEAKKEITFMLAQNIWKKFASEEMEVIMSNDVEKGSYSPSGKVHARG